MKIISIPRWYPTKKNKNNGIFFKIQNDLLSDYVDLYTIYIEVPNMVVFLKNRLYRNELYYKNKNVQYCVVPSLPKIKHFQKSIHYIAASILFKKYVKKNGLPDLIHAHITWLAGDTALKLGRKYNIPVVITEHHSAILDHEFLMKNVRNNVNKADAFITVSSFLKEGINNDDIQVIPNFIKPTEARTYEKNDKNEFLLITITNMTPNKNTILLLKSLEILKNKGIDLKLKIIGDGPQAEYLKNYVEEHELINVSFLGVLDNEEVQKILTKANLYISTSYVETFGVSLLESLSLGVPIITTDSGGIKDIMTTDTGIIIHDFSPENLAEKIEWIYNNPDSFERKKIIEDYEKKFNPHLIIRTYLELYEKIINEKKKI